MKFFNIKYAIKGIRTCLKEESNFRIHVLAGVLITLAGYYYNISKEEWLIQTLCVGLIIFAETVNTAIENLVDLVSPEWNEKAGKVKDLSLIHI